MLLFHLIYTADRVHMPYANFFLFLPFTSPYMTVGLPFHIHPGKVLPVEDTSGLSLEKSPRDFPSDLITPRFHHRFRSPRISLVCTALLIRSLCSTAPDLSFAQPCTAPPIRSPYGPNRSTIYYIIGVTRP
jgi:hypothetical protein